MWTSGSTRNVLSACFLTWTFVTSLLVHIRQKVKIALEIAAKSLVWTGLYDTMSHWIFSEKEGWELWRGSETTKTTSEEKETTDGKTNRRKQGAFVAQAIYPGEHVFATFPRVWIRPSKHGNHKVLVYSNPHSNTKHPLQAQTIERLLKKQVKSRKEAEKQRRIQKADVPRVTYLNNKNGISISFPVHMEVPFKRRVQER